MFFTIQVSRNFSNISYTTDVVLAFKLPYNWRLYPDELENEIGSNFSDFNEVCLHFCDRVIV